MDKPTLKENPYFEIEKTLEEFQKFTGYDMTMFDDRVVEKPWTFVQRATGEKVDGNDVVYLQHHEGEVIIEGTNLSARNLGNMDVAIAILFKWITYLKESLLQISLKADSLGLTTLNGLIANAFNASFFDLGKGDIEVIKGYYDKAAGQIWS
ncbi:hypothetical protein FL857_05875 [Criibacterium bergeronii]|uniref:Uncharacterized protein n=1 Tax=Criibacterium bergeronii TaxID=1871336 RepID=A0A552V6V8_9FIRM|nr:hypothetical protein [Criibacterium bergeronii]TRW26213.1 hypothetical protein FL857_05875 [Criibacterium bergeronii]